MFDLSKAYFYDEAEAFAYVERLLWADGIVCPHCRAAGGRVYTLEGKSTRLGLKKCGECRKQFTVKVGTIFEHARMPLNKVLQAVYLLTSTKNGISARQLHYVLEVSYKSAWYLARRIREVVSSGEVEPPCGVADVLEGEMTAVPTREGADLRKGAASQPSLFLAAGDR